MSSTRNSQNLLVNVFRPTYVFDGCGFSAGVVATNIKTLDVSLVRATTVTMGDPGGNVYIGTGSGVVYSQLLSNSNVTAIGANAAAAISNVQTSVFIGTNTGIGNLNSSNTVIIGANANAFGTKNIILGNGSYVSGSNNILIGSDISLNGSNKLKIGNILTADISSAATLNISGVSRFDGSVGVFLDPSYNLDVSGNFRVSDASGSLVFTNGSAVADGFLTLRGTSTLAGLGTTNIYPLKRGITNIAARNVADPSDYVFGPLFIMDPSVNQFLPDDSQVVRARDLNIDYDIIGYNLKLYNSNVSSMNVVWSLTYQPL